MFYIQVELKPDLYGMQVDGGHHRVNLRVLTSAGNEEDVIPSTQDVPPEADDDHQEELASTPQEVVSASGYNSDDADTHKQVAVEKSKLVEQARHIADSAVRVGKSPELAIRASDLAKSVSPDLLSEILDKVMSLGDKQLPPPDVRISRTKRPIQQISSASDQSVHRDNPSMPRTRMRQTYTRRV